MCAKNDLGTVSAQRGEGTAYSRDGVRRKPAFYREHAASAMLCSIARPGGPPVGHESRLRSAQVVSQRIERHGEHMVRSHSIISTPMYILYNVFMLLRNSERPAKVWAGPGPAIAI